MASTHGESNDLFFSGRCNIDCNRVIHNDAHRGVNTLQYNKMTLCHQIAFYSSLYEPFFNPIMLGGGGGGWGWHYDPPPSLKAR